MAYYDSLDFLNLNSLRNYPIKEGVTRQDITEVFTLPNDFLVDAVFTVSSDPSKRLYLSKLVTFTTYIIVEISDDDDILVGTFVIDPSTHTTYKAYYLAVGESYAGAHGKIVIGRLDGLLNSPTGTFNFLLTAAEFEYRTVIPSLSGIDRMIFTNIDDTSFSLSGDVTILARTNIRFSQGSGNQVIIDVGEGLGLNTECLSDNCIRTINGIAPDEDYNFTIDFSDCANLAPLASLTGLVIQDVCCKPCTGCDELQDITIRLNEVESSLLDLKSFLLNMQALIDQFQAIFAGGP